MWQLPSPLQTIAPLHHTMPQREQPTAVNPSSPHVVHCCVTADVRDRAQAHVVLEKNKNKQAVPAFAWTSTRARPVSTPCLHSERDSALVRIGRQSTCQASTLLDRPAAIAQHVRISFARKPFLRKYCFADGHTALNAPDLFRPPRLSSAGPG